MNKSSISTIITLAALSIAKKAYGSNNKSITITSFDALIRYAHDPKLAPLVNRIHIEHEPEEITSIPSEIGNLTNLESLYLHHNYITSIPSEIGKLVNLKQIDITDNEITYISPEIGNLTNLEEISINEYMYSRPLPPEIGKLVNLKRLYITGKNIRSIPPEISNLKNLQTLGIYETSIREIPFDASFLSRIRWFFHDNEHLRIKQSLIKDCIQLGMRRYKIEELMEYIDTNPTSPIRRF